MAQSKAMFKGIALKVASTMAFAGMATLIKFLAADVSVSEIVLFRSLFSLVTLLAWLRYEGALPSALRTRRPLGHVGRSVAGTFGMFANFIALMTLPIAKATAFSFATPLMVVPLATIALGEKAHAFRWGAVGVGFVGVLVMLADKLFGDTNVAASHFGEAVALVGAFISAIATIQTRRLTKTEQTGAIVFYFFVVTTLVSGALLAVGPAVGDGAFWSSAVHWTSPTSTEFSMLVGVGLLGGIGQILMTQSYHHADASVTAAFDYTSILWTAALGAAFFGEDVSRNVALGAGIVAAAGLAILFRERARRRHEAGEIAPASIEGALAEKI